MASLVVFIGSVVIGALVSLGHGVLSFVNIAGLDILGMLDFVSNSVIMPVVAFLTCIFVGYIVKPGFIIEEIESNGKFKGKMLFTVVIKYIAPVCILLILGFSVLEGLGVIKV